MEETEETDDLLLRKTPEEDSAINGNNDALCSRRRLDCCSHGKPRLWQAIGFVSLLLPTTVFFRILLWSAYSDLAQQHGFVGSESEKKKLLIFIMAGQSNTVGFGSVLHLKHLVEQGRRPYAELWDKDTNSWVERPHVRVILPPSFPQTAEPAPLSVGLGFNASYIGPELGFGWELSNQLSNNIVIIKAAWNAKSLAVHFRPPSAGIGAYKNYRNDPIPEHRYGECYRNMLQLINSTVDFLERRHYSYEFQGFVWFQGWNDQNADKVEEYASNLAHLIRDIRIELDEPKLFIVVGESGQHRKPKDRAKIERLREQQRAVTLMDEFQNTTIFVPTTPYVHDDRPEQYNAGYHFSGHADSYFEIGQAFGRGMVQLLETGGIIGYKT